MTQERKICFICSNFIELEGVLDTCKHGFCFECIFQCSEESDQCPVCNATFTLIYKITKMKKNIQEQSEYSSQRPKPSFTPPKRRRSVILVDDDDTPTSQGTPVKDYNSEEEPISEKTTAPKSLFGELSPLRRSLPELPKKRRTLLTNSTQEVRSSSILKQKNTQGESLSQSAARGFAKLSQVPSSQQSPHTPDAFRSSFYNHLQSKKFDNSFGMKPKDSQEVAMSKFIRTPLKDIMNLKKPPSCSQETPKPIQIPKTTITTTSLEEPEPLNDNNDFNKYSFNSVFNSESTIYEDQNPNNISVDRVSVGSNYSDELADLTPTQVSQALADTLNINEDENRYLHSFHTVCHIRTLLEPLYPKDLDKEEYKKVAKSVTAQFFGGFSDEDYYLKPVLLSPSRKTKIQQLLDQELTKTVIGRSLF